MDELGIVKCTVDAAGVDVFCVGMGVVSIASEFVGGGATTGAVG